VDGCGLPCRLRIRAEATTDSTSEFSCSATISNGWREKMWVVADLDDDYIAKVEDVLEVYERPL
jgi:hypothetical protein